MEDNKTITYKKYKVTPLKKGVYVVRDAQGVPVYNALSVIKAKDFINAQCGAKIYTSAPLPFQGQKRLFLKEFKDVITMLPDDVTIVDLFGGSGLLSRAAKDVKPNAKVIYNDFDNYTGRLNQIDRTNNILDAIRIICQPLRKGEKVPAHKKHDILEFLVGENKKNAIDIITISSNLTFSGKFVSDLKGLAKNGFYNNVVKRDYNSDGYLDGVEVCREYYKELYARYKDEDSVFFILDPPYLSTDVKSYCSYWRIRDYIAVLKIFNEARGFIYFTSEKSQLIELLCEMSDICGFRNPFTDCCVKTHNNTINYSSNYNDIMYYKLGNKVIMIY